MERYVGGSRRREKKCINRSKYDELCQYNEGVLECVVCPDDVEMMAAL